RHGVGRSALGPVVLQSAPRSVGSELRQIHAQSTPTCSRGGGARSAAVSRATGNAASVDVLARIKVFWREKNGSMAAAKRPRFGGLDVVFNEGAGPANRDAQVPTLAQLAAEAIVAAELFSHHASRRELRQSLPAEAFELVMQA